MSDIQFGIYPSGVHYVCVNIKHTKTTTHDFPLLIGFSKPQVCAVCPLKYYISSRYQQPGFLQVPLFVFSNNVILYKQMFISQVKLYLSAPGLDPSLFSGHSVRCG